MSTGSSLTWKTLLIRPVASCNGNCIGCPWLSSSNKKNVLPVQLLDKFLKVLKERIFNEVVLLCPNPFLHPKIDCIIARLRKYADKVYAFVPINHVRLLNKKQILDLDELVIVISSYINLFNEYSYIKSLLSHGIETISVYLALRRDSISMENISVTINYCRNYGLRLRIGEIPFSNTYVLNLQKYFQEKGYEVTLPYGYLYGYRASVGYINNYKVTLLDKPLYEECRKIYIDPSGRVYKCPFVKEFIDIEKGITLNELRKTIFSPCPIKRLTGEYIPSIKISLVSTNGVVIPSDILDLLEVIMHTRSFRTACNLLGYSPSTYIEKIRSIEKKLGFKLLTTRKGGYLRGMSMLTPEAKKLLEKYKAVRECISEKLFESDLKHFIF